MDKKFATLVAFDYATNVYIQLPDGSREHFDGSREAIEYCNEQGITINSNIVVGAAR